MKKYMFTFLAALTIGFFLSSFFIKQYDQYNEIKISNNGEELYFIQYGVFSSIESMEENTISLQNYVYNEENNQYYVYVGITKENENANKIIKYYKELGYDTIIKKFSITSKQFLELLVNYDSILKQTEDETAISSIINQVLIKYEEVVINGN